jgi:Mce-associated membrane protein
VHLHSPSGQRFCGDNVVLRVELAASGESSCGCPGDSLGPVTDSHDDPATTDAPASLAEAEEEVIRAESRAEEARARAAELRRQVEADSDETSDAAADVDDVDETESASGRSRRWRLPRVPRVPRPSRKAVITAAATAVISASLIGTAYMVWQHYALLRERRHAAEFVAAAQKGVATLMSIDPDHARQSVERTIDLTTGALKSQLQATSVYMVKNAEEAKVATTATAETAAVESMTDNSAVVLVVAKSETTNPDKSKRPTVFWRISVNIDRDGGQLKMSKLDFVQ